MRLQKEGNIFTIISSIYSPEKKTGSLYFWGKDRGAFTFPEITGFRYQRTGPAPAKER